MYSWIWRHLPGGTATKVASAVALILALSAFLLFVAFPRVVPLLPFDRVTVGG